MSTINHATLDIRRRYLGLPTNIVELLGFAVWGIAIGIGLLLILQFSFTPGPKTAAPLQWPEQSSLPHHPGRAGLLMFVHPRCPCTNASLEQLKQILFEARVPFDCTVVFLIPPEASENWKASPIIQAVKELSTVNVVIDSGLETRRFAAVTSGQVMLYDASGQLSFNGGITISRGHRGENSGTKAVIQSLNDQVMSSHQTPTFGCPLFQELSSCRDAAPCQR